jgi:aminoglycoside phosphotransferase (APT) family kinase protein
LHKLGLPVPRPYLLCEDDSVIGTAFYVMDFAAGRVFWEPHMPDMSAQDRGGIFSAMNGFMADLHSAGYETAGLADFGKPEGYVARQIARWSKQYKASETSKHRQHGPADGLAARCRSIVRPGLAGAR